MKLIEIASALYNNAAPLGKFVRRTAGSLYFLCKSLQIGAQRTWGCHILGSGCRVFGLSRAFTVAASAARC
ncbi:MAG: hypothetical protein AAGE76_16070, partial [Pseudomonadota bacterium]